MLVLDPQRLRRAREAAGLSQETAAHMAGATSGALAKWEHGQSHPRSHYIARLAEIYGVEMESLFVFERAAVS